MAKSQQQQIAKHSPTRCSRPGYKAKRLRYITEQRRAKNKARRIVRASLCSYDPRKVAINVAAANSGMPVRGYVDHYLKQRNL